MDSCFCPFWCRAWRHEVIPLKSDLLLLLPLDLELPMEIKGEVVAVEEVARQEHPCNISVGLRVYIGFLVFFMQCHKPRQCV